MLAKSFILAALVGMASAGFLEGPAVVAPGYARYTAPAYYSSPIAYHAPLAYHAPIAVSAAPASKAEAPPAKEVAPTKAAVTAAEDDADYDPNPSYSFSYDVKDEETGDTKTQSESLENGVVKGSYTVVDPDGTKRTVEYTADAVNGFKAVVNMEPSDVVIKAPASKVPAPAPAPAAAPAPAPSPAPAAPAKAAVVTAAAPAFYHAPHLAYHTPLAYHAPVAKVLSVPVSKVVQSPLSYSTSHVYHPSTVTYATAPVHHKFIYA